MSKIINRFEINKENISQNSSKVSSLPPEDDIQVIEESAELKIVGHNKEDCNSKLKRQKRLNKDNNDIQKEQKGHISNVNIRIPPRSCLQFKIGPPFQIIKNYCKVISATTNQTIKFNVTPRIDRGFDLIGNEWVGYKRNYLTLVAAFQTNIPDNNKFIQDSYMIEINEGHFVPIEYFAIKILAKSNKGLTEVSLVQHTSKRDKGPHFKPQLCPLLPAKLPDHKVIRDIANLRNQNKMKVFDSSFFYHRDKEKINIFPTSVAYGYPNECIDKVARFERIQFATSINSKKVNERSKFFKLHVLFGAVVDYPIDSFQNEIMENDENLSGSKNFIYIQELNTPPLIVRGRSPSTYNNNTIHNAIVITEEKSKIKKSKKNNNRTIVNKVVTPKIKNLLNTTPEIKNVHQNLEIFVNKTHREISPNNSTSMEYISEDDTKKKKSKKRRDHDFLQTSSPLKSIIKSSKINKNTAHKRINKKSKVDNNINGAVNDENKPLKIPTLLNQKIELPINNFDNNKIFKVKAKRGRPRLKKIDAPEQYCKKESFVDNVARLDQSLLGLSPKSDLIQTLENIENDIKNNMFNLSSVIKLKHLDESKQEQRRKIFRSNSVNMKDIELLSKEKDGNERIETNFEMKKDFFSNLTTNYNKITTFNSKFVHLKANKICAVDKNVNKNRDNLKGQPMLANCQSDMENIINMELQQMSEIHNRRTRLLSSSSSNILNNEISLNSHIINNELSLNSNMFLISDNNYNDHAVLYGSNSGSKDCSRIKYSYNYNNYNFNRNHNHIHSQSHNYIYKCQTRDNNYIFEPNENLLHDSNKLVFPRILNNCDYNHNSNSMSINALCDTSSSNNKPVSYSFIDESQIDYSEIKTFFGNNTLRLEDERDKPPVELRNYHLQNNVCRSSSKNKDVSSVVVLNPKSIAGRRDHR